jgi:hypothetical protein
VLLVAVKVGIGLSSTTPMRYFGDLLAGIVAKIVAQPVDDMP